MGCASSQPHRVVHSLHLCYGPGGPPDSCIVYVDRYSSYLTKKVSNLHIFNLTGLADEVWKNEKKKKDKKASTLNGPSTGTSSDYSKVPVS